jgi:NitT/TauT family transport system substrate-binding protein
MPFKRALSRWTSVPVAWRLFLVAGIWFGLISWLHFWLNLDRGEQQIVRMGYMPVISNLSAPLLDHLTQRQGPVYFQAIKFASFAEMAEALRNDQIQVAFMIAPLSIVLHQQKADVKVVYIGNRNESTLVARQDLGVHRVQDLAGKTIAVPMRYSGHNLCLLQLMESLSLKGKIKVVEMNPPDMAAALLAGSLDAYFVGEPFAAKVLQRNEATLVHYVEEIWPDFICNLMIVRESMINKDPELIQLLVQGAARASKWALDHTHDAAKIVCQYWNQPSDLVEYALSTPANRIRYDQFVPRLDELQYMADLMLHFNLISHNDIAGLVDDRFAKRVDLAGITDFKSVLKPVLTAPY